MPLKKTQHEFISFPMAIAGFVTFAVGVVFGTVLQPNVIRLRYAPPSITIAAPSEKGGIVNVKDDLIKTQVDSALSMLGELQSKVETGALTLAQAKKIGADELRAMKYGSEGYFFADTTEGVNVVLPGSPDVEGTNRMNAELGGIKYVQSIISAGRNGGGYTDYVFPKPGQKDSSPKRAYSMEFKPFGWVVGTGYYK
jgi:methyl-accepting chemotaxis protein